MHVNRGKELLKTCLAWTQDITTAPAMVGKPASGQSLLERDIILRSQEKHGILPLPTLQCGGLVTVFGTQWPLPCHAG